MIRFGARFSLKLFLCSLAATAGAAVLFAASFPNILAAEGIPFLAWIALAPLFWVIQQTSMAGAVFWGALYGYAAYGLFNYWLSLFHPLAGLIVGLIYLGYFALLCPLLKLALLLFPRRGYVLQWLLWIAYEWLRTQGFLGYGYGIMGYSQWNLLPLIQIADIFGVWGVSSLLVFPSVYLAAAVREGRGFFRREWIAGGLWVCALGGTLIYGFLGRVDYSADPVVRLALIQHNTDPWKGDIEENRKDLRVLKRLSQEALAENPKPDLVVWCETAFVPRIYWHETYRDDPESYLLVRDLLDFLAKQDAPFVIGNGDSRKEVDSQGVWQRVDYNAALLFNQGKLLGQYRKLHLVPFTEYFPYEKQFPRIYKALKEADTHFWEKGREATVFTLNGLAFSTPICFEDTFGYLSRNFTQRGAKLIVNITNDAWSKSLPAQMQHAAMAVFRAVENRRSVARAAASGQTCGIDPNGKVLAMAEPFQEGYLMVDLPITERRSFYTRYGDLWAYLCVAGALAALLAGMGMRIIRTRR